MSVLTLVQRALPFSFWKRRSLTSKGKERDGDVEDLANSDFQDSNPVLGKDAESPSTTLHCDVFDAVHVAVNHRAEQVNPDSAYNEIPDTDSASDSISDYQTHQQPGDPCESSALSKFRVVSWASIVRSERRWTTQQEKELLMAEKQLARCQKAWSSEQELWLGYVQTLSEEKEAHDGFILMRTRQQEDERNQFRKAWKRRRSVESSVQESQVNTTREYSNGALKLRRIPRYGYLGPILAAGSSTPSPVACRG